MFILFLYIIKMAKVILVRNRCKLEYFLPNKIGFGTLFHTTFYFFELAVKDDSRTSKLVRKKKFVEQFDQIQLLKTILIQIKSVSRVVMTLPHGRAAFLCSIPPLGLPDFPRAGALGKSGSPRGVIFARNAARPCGNVPKMFYFLY